MVMEPHVSVNAAQAKVDFGSHAKKVLDQLRSDFEARYGSYASHIRQHGAQKFVSTVRFNDELHEDPSTMPTATAGRILRAAANNRPFQMAFAGYSVTVGRGNFFKQSYPFVLQSILQPVLNEIFQMDLIVRNAAIGGIPSFPYAFCLEHFLGSAPDVISWDFSMNELGKDNTAVLEAFIRHSQHQLLKSRPMIVSLDTHSGRCSLLKQYTEKRLLQDALCVGKADAIFSKSDLTKFDSESSAKSTQLPLGLQEWAEFGSPKSCPGRSGWHPKKKEHELIAWVIAMEFVDEIEKAVHIAESDPDWIAKFTSEIIESPDEPIFPKPLSSTVPDNHGAASIDYLLYGHELGIEKYQIHHVSCRTNFLPATDHAKVLPNIVVSGLASGPTADNIMTDRTDRDYSTGWVLDVSKLERDTKVKVEKCGGLGYEDMKIALYGVPESGPLRLWLPIESYHILDDEDHHGNHKHDTKVGDSSWMLASHWMDSLVLCEANEKRSPEACQLDQDLQVTVGGVEVSPSSIMLMHGAGEYLKRPTCVHVSIPEKAQMTAIDQVQTMDNTLIDEATKRRLHQGLSKSSYNTKDMPLIGLTVDVRTSSRVQRKTGACCLSHVAWEMH